MISINDLWAEEAPYTAYREAGIPCGSGKLEAEMERLGPQPLADSPRPQGRKPTYMIHAISANGLEKMRGAERENQSDRFVASCGLA